jgi:hypothetical protein
LLSGASSSSSSHVGVCEACDSHTHTQAHALNARNAMAMMMMGALRLLPVFGLFTRVLCE